MSCTDRQAVEYFQSILNLDQNNGETWGSLGHCYLMMDDLQKAYSAYQQALYHLQNPKEPKLWYGIGILYDRYGSLEHAEEAFSQVMRMDPTFEKANEIYFRLGIIYKQQHKYSQSLEVRLTGDITNLVLPLHHYESSETFDRGRHLVPDWTRLRTTEGIRESQRGIRKGLARKPRSRKGFATIGVAVSSAEFGICRSRSSCSVLDQVTGV